MCVCYPRGVCARVCANSACAQVHVCVRACTYVLASVCVCAYCWRARMCVRMCCCVCVFFARAHVCGDV